MGFSKIRGKLTSRVGCRVNFGAPKDVHEAGGKGVGGRIIDEVWAYPETNELPPRQAGTNDWGDYAFCSQLIEWDSGERYIRLAYYRRRAGEDWWEYASQMTACSDPETIKRLLERTLAQSAWFEKATKEDPPTAIAVEDSGPGVAEG